MRRYLFAIILLLCNCATPFADQRELHIEWGYTPPSTPLVVGYSLYMEGVKVCYFEGAHTTAGNCSVELTLPVHSFTLTANFADNTESPHSSIFRFTVPVPAPTVISITIH